MLTACASTEFLEKQSEPAKQGVYAIPTALANGRIDEVDSISLTLKKLYTPPKTLLTIDPIIDPLTGKMDVILPARLNGKVLLFDSPEYLELVKNKTINQQLATENQELKAYNSSVTVQLASDQKALNDLLIKYNKDEALIKSYQGSIFYKAYIAIQSLWVIIPLGIGGAVLLCVFFPALAPVILSVAGTVIGTIIRLAWMVITGIFSGIGSLISASTKSTTTTTIP